MPDLTNGGSPEVDDSQGGVEPTPEPANLSLSASEVKDSPEYKALATQYRLLAREKGTWEGKLTAARTEAEQARQAAEAERQEALQRQLREQLGEEGVALYQEIAELSLEDPMAAALRVAELAKAAKGQTQPAAAAAAPAAETNGTEEPQEDGVNVNAQSSAPPPPPGQGLDGGQPLGAATTGEDQAQIISDLNAEFDNVVARNQNPATRNRVTMRDRARAMISYLGASYLGGGARPSSR